jgi:mRNA interferase HigB
MLEAVRVISRKAIIGFSRVHRDAEAPLDAWYRTVLRARWGNLTQARMDFPHADAVGERTVFNFGGNKYRLIARVNYRTQKVFVLTILTHAEYDKDAWEK